MGIDERNLETAKHGCFLSEKSAQSLLYHCTHPRPRLAWVALAASKACSSARSAMAPLMEPLTITIVKPDVDRLGLQLRSDDEKPTALRTLVTITGTFFGNAGLKVGDVVVSVNGVQVEGANHACSIIIDVPAGSKISLLVERSIYAAAAIDEGEEPEPNQKTGWWGRKKTPPKRATQRGKGSAFVDIVPSSPVSSPSFGSKANGHWMA